MSTVTPPGSLSAALRSALATGRAEYNARFAAARQQMRTLDAESFAAYLHDTVDPVVGGLAAGDGDPVAVSQVLDTLYDLGLTLVARGWLGPATRQPALAAAWRDWLLALGPRLAEAPACLAGSGWNALLQLAAVPGIALTTWVSAVRSGVTATASTRCLTSDASPPGMQVRPTSGRPRWRQRCACHLWRWRRRWICRSPCRAKSGTD